MSPEEIAELIDRKIAAHEQRFSVFGFLTAILFLGIGFILASS